MMLVSQQVGKLSNAPQFAYIAMCGFKTDIFLADFNTHIIVPMTHDGAGKGNILWSPNGEFLAYTTSIGIHMITPDGEVESVTQVADYNIQWIDDSHLLFQRRNDEPGNNYGTFIIDIESDEIQPSEAQYVGSPWTGGGYFATNNNVGIFRWATYQGGTGDLYITTADDFMNIQGRFTIDGNICIEADMQFRP